MAQLSKKARANMEKKIGLSTEELGNLSVDEEIAYLEKRQNTKIEFSQKNHPLLRPRSSPLLAEDRIITREEMEKKLDEIAQRPMRVNVSK